MEPHERFDEAQRRAENYAPRPKKEAGIVGLLSAIGTVMAVTVFCAVAGLDTERLKTAILWTAAIFFLVPYLALKWQERRHSKAVMSEFERLGSAGIGGER